MVYFEGCSDHADDAADALKYIFQFRALHRIEPYPVRMLTTRRDWHADYLEEQKPPVKEVEPELGFTRISWFEDGRLPQSYRK
jgi:hypothetical protein